MNTDKLQKDFLARMLKRYDQNKICHGYVDDNICLTDSTAIYIMPKNKCLLNMENSQRPVPINFNNIFKTEKGTVLAEKSPELTVVNQSGKKFYLVHLFNNDIHVYVNQNLIKYFNDDCQYFISGEKKPVYVREYDELVGIVLPVNRNGEGGVIGI